MAQLEWIAVDWGTSNLRIWAMGENDTILSQGSSPKGMGTLEKDRFEPALLELIGDLLPQDKKTPVVCCGMVGARQGWQEAAYLKVPCLTPDADQCATVPTDDPRIDVCILPGVSQLSPPDVMRGEETQILGFLAEFPEFEGILCLPGTHSKWVEIAGREIRGFRTSMTGELFALLGKSSVLRHSVADGDWDVAAFGEAVNEAFQAPAVPGSLFSIRAADLLCGASPGSAKSRLSGLLIGSELAGLHAMFDGRPVVLLGADALSELYRDALAIRGVHATLANADRMTLNGLTAAHKSLKETGRWTAH